MALTLRHVGGLLDGADRCGLRRRRGDHGEAWLVRSQTQGTTPTCRSWIPDPERLNDRLAAVLHVIYLIFTEGHARTDGQREPSGVDLVRGSLCDEARWLSRMVADLLPDEPEANGLAALPASPTPGDTPASTPTARWCCSMNRTDHVGTRQQTPKATTASPGHSNNSALVRSNCRRQSPPFTPGPDGGRRPTGAHIANLYRRLMEVAPSAVVALNAAVAESMVHGPEHGLTLLDTLEASGSTGALPVPAGRSSRPPPPARTLGRRRRAVPPAPT
ncbi:MAG: DUF6596 domain-containing protein [Acidimicrobiales bacterium]